MKHILVALAVALTAASAPVIAADFVDAQAKAAAPEWPLNKERHRKGFCGEPLPVNAEPLDDIYSLYLREALMHRMNKGDIGYKQAIEEMKAMACPMSSAVAKK